MAVSNPIPRDHIRACPDHGVVSDGEGDHGCPVCETDADARPGAVEDMTFTQEDLRWQIDPGTMMDLLPALIADAERDGLGPVYVAVAEIPETELAAGYTRQERWFNVAVAETGPNSREVIAHNQTARKIADQIQNGEPYLEPEGADASHLTPDAWRGIAEPYARDVEYKRVDETTLHILMSGFPSDNAYSQARKEIGAVASDVNLSVSTLDAGGRFSDAKVKVSADG